MQIEGIDRLVIGVKDLDRARHLFEEVLGMRFTEIEGDAARIAGCRLAIDLDHHIELISPVAAPEIVTNPPDPLTLKRRLEAEGDGILYAVILKVKNLDEAIDAAARRGVRVAGNRVTFARDEQLGLSNFDEVALDERDTLGLKLALSQYERDPRP